MVILDAYIDDLVCATQGTESEVRDTLGSAAGQLAKAIRDDLGSEVAIPKAAVVASSDRLAAGIRKRLGTLGGKLTKVAANLGIDFHPGRARSHIKGAMLLRTRRIALARKSCIF